MTSQEPSPAALTETEPGRSAHSGPRVPGSVKIQSKLLAPKSRGARKNPAPPSISRTTTPTSQQNRPTMANNPLKANTEFRTPTPPRDQARDCETAANPAQSPKQTPPQAGQPSAVPKTTAAPTTATSLPPRTATPAAIPPRPAHPQGSTDRAPASEAASNVGSDSTNEAGREVDRPRRAVRLRSGELRALVAQTLTERQGDGFTVTQLSNMLRRSPGAIANAAERLCEQGVAVRAQHSPRTYRSVSEKAGA